MSLMLPVTHAETAFKNKATASAHQQRFSASQPMIRSISGAMGMGNAGSDSRCDVHPILPYEKDSLARCVNDRPDNQRIAVVRQEIPKAVVH